MKYDYRCPRCYDAGMWRRGFHFDHEKICRHCKLIWEPQKEATSQHIIEMKKRDKAINKAIKEATEKVVKSLRKKE